MSFQVKQHPPNLTSRFDEFLFASVCVETGGHSLSVLSALARMDVDPWEQASRLAAMPNPAAVKTLAVALGSIQQIIWSDSEAEAAATRLIQLLPQGSEPSPTAKMPSSGAPLTGYWWIWVAFAVAMALHSPRHRATTKQDVPAPASSPIKNINPPNIISP
jgi:hypothetical protein